MTDLNWPELWDEDEQRYRVMTRNGREARVYTRQGCNPLWPVVGEVQDNGSVGEWRCVGWTADGRYHQSGDASCSPLDLIPEPRTVRRWVHVYKSDNGSYFFPICFESEARAIEWKERQSGNSTLNHITTIPVEWEEN